MLPGELNHARGNVAGNELNPLPGEMNSVDTSATVKFEQLLAWGEDLCEPPPNGIAPCLANTGAAKILDIGLGRSVPVCLRKVSRVGTHRDTDREGVLGRTSIQ